MEDLGVSDNLLQACKELVDDAKISCADLVFKDICLEILSKARSVLTEESFQELKTYAAERIKETIPIRIHHKIRR
jgi:hypothetical protein